MGYGIVCGLDQAAACSGKVSRYFPGLHPVHTASTSRSALFHCLSDAEGEQAAPGPEGDILQHVGAKGRHSG
ncbi:hypothetical protein GCM10010343_13700 [Streptomyces avidinii]|nr:hypothetical protein GCM10010343_13700 [Streptomyces avidinii]